MGAVALAEHVRATSRSRFRRNHARRRLHAGSGVLPGQLRMLAGGRDQRRAVGPRDARRASTKCWRSSTRSADERRRSMFRAIPRRCRWVRSAVADAIAAEAQRARKLNRALVRNGSRGLYWLEPMVEVETARGRVAYGPVSPADVAGLFDADFLDGGEHRLALGSPRSIAYLKRQERLTFARSGITDPVSLDDYVAHGGYRGLAARAFDVRGEDRRRGHRVGICADAAVRAFPQESNGGPRSRPRGASRNMSSATPTRATPALSPTA